MSWITIVYSMASATCLTLAAQQFLIWLYSREARASLLFALAAAAAAGMAFLEVKLMRAASPAEYSDVLRWMHFVVATMVISIVWFVAIFLRAGRRWLAWSVTGLRLLILFPNVFFYSNATFANIDSLNYVDFWGEVFAVPSGEENPWRWMIHLSMLLFLAYVLDASVMAWKQGQRRRALMFGGAISSALVISATFSGLMVKGVLPSPFVTLIFLIIVIAMAFELSVDLLHARQLAKDLDTSQQRMRLAAQAAALGMWEWDIEKDRVWVNETGRAPLGIGDSDPMTLDDYFQLVHPDDRVLARQAVDRALKGKAYWQTEFRIVDPNGETQWLAVHGQVERGAGGKPLRMRGISMDISGHKQAETELRRQRLELAHVQRVAVMGQLSSALAHELNQPLAAILRNAEAAELFLNKDSPDLHELREIVEDIRNDEERAASVIERMRSLIKHRELRLENLAIEELIGQVANILRSEIQMHQADLQFDVSPERLQVWGDRVQLQQLIINLVLNSLDALEGQSADRRTVMIQARMADADMIEVAVIDRGIGIAAEQLPRVFEAFVTSKTEGLGMGLAIAKQIVELHGGTISAETHPGGGTTVRFTLKVAQPEGGYA